MSNFGFKISPSSTINLDKTDKSLYEELCAIEPDAKKCIACGSCSATCPSANFSGMSIRKLILLLQRGKIDELPEMLSACMLCGKCTIVCPRGINTRNIVLTITKIYKK